MGTGKRREVYRRMRRYWQVAANEPDVIRLATLHDSGVGHLGVTVTGNQLLRVDSAWPGAH
jgi:hypothetical protein